MSGSHGVSGRIDRLLPGLLLAAAGGRGEGPLLPAGAAGTTVMMPGSPSLLPAAPMDVLLLLTVQVGASWQYCRVQRAVVESWLNSILKLFFSIRDFTLNIWGQGTRVTDDP